MPNRERTDAKPPEPIPDPFEGVGSLQIDNDPRLTEDETRTVFEQYLRQDQRKDNKLMKFILCYLECRNASQAAREAGLGSGSYWRSRPEVHACIEALTAKSVMKYGYDAHEVIERVKEISNIDPICLENPDGSYKTNLSQVPPEARRAIKKFRAKNLWGKDANGMNVVIGQLIDVEMFSKEKMLELLGREKNIMKETKRLEHDVTANMTSLLLDSSRRADEVMKTIDVTPKAALTGGVDEESGIEAAKERDHNNAGRDGEDLCVAVAGIEGDRTRAIGDIETMPWEDKVGGGIQSSVCGGDSGGSGDGRDGPL